MSHSIEYLIEIQNQTKSTLKELRKSVLNVSTAYKQISKQSVLSTSKVSKSLKSQKSSLSSTLTSVKRLVGAYVGFSVIRSAIASYTEFEQKMSNVNTLTQYSAKNLKILSDQVIKLSEVMPRSKSDMATGLYNVVSAGIKASDQMRVLRGSTKLAVGGIGTVNEAVNIATSSINAFGLKGDQVDRVFNTLFLGVKAGKTTVSELATGFGSAATVFAQAGGSINELISMTSALTTTGTPAAEAYTQVRQAIFGLIKGANTQAGKGMYKALGVKDFKELIKVKGGVVKAINAVVVKLKGNTQLINQFFGSTRAYALVAALGADSVTGKYTKTGKAYLSMMAQTKRDSTSLAKAYAIQMHSLSNKWQLLKNSVGNTADELISVFAPSMKGAMESIAIMIKNMGKWIKNNHELILSVVGMIKIMLEFYALTKGILLFRKAFILYTATMKAFKFMLRLVKGEQIALNAVMAMNPIGLIVTAVVLLIAGLVLLIYNWKEVKKIAIEVGKSIKKWWMSFISWLPNAWKKAVQRLKQNLKEFWNDFKGMFGFGSSTVNGNIKHTLEKSKESLNSHPNKKFKQISQQHTKIQANFQTHATISGDINLKTDKGTQATKVDLKYKNQAIQTPSNRGMNASMAK